MDPMTIMTLAGLVLAGVTLGYTVWHDHKKDREDRDEQDERDDQDDREW